MYPPPPHPDIFLPFSGRDVRYMTGHSTGFELLLVSTRTWAFLLRAAVETRAAVIDGKEMCVCEREVMLDVSVF